MQVNDIIQIDVNRWKDNMAVWSSEWDSKIVDYFRDSKLLVRIMDGNKYIDGVSFIKDGIPEERIYKSKDIGGNEDWAFFNERDFLNNLVNVIGHYEYNDVPEEKESNYGVMISDCGHEWTTCAWRLTLEEAESVAREEVLDKGIHAIVFNSISRYKRVQKFEVESTKL